ncbi:homoserine dehydrogenase [Thermoplasmatales archaeon]|nr:homoserine dehydrogenase [Thermoplasmatales archaeon]
MGSNQDHIEIALMGLGNVGKNFLSILSRNNRSITRKTGKEIRITFASDSQSIISSRDGLPAEKLLKAKEGGKLKDSWKEARMDDLYADSPDIIVDMTPATPDGLFGKELYSTAFKHGIDIVTANKSPLAMHWTDVMNSARINKRRIRYEATVAGGTPLFNLVDYSLMPVEIVRIRGIVSMTVNYVLDRMLHNLDFEQSIRMAQREGIAETNFHDDTLGTDSARKTVIVADSIFGANISLKDLDYDGVESISDRIDEMKRSGERYRIVSDVYRKGNEVLASSKLQQMEPLDPLVTLGTSSLCYLLETTDGSKYFVGNIRDGPLETASAVLNDVMLLSREIV